MTSNCTQQVLDVEKTLAGLRERFGSTSSVSLYGSAELASRYAGFRDGCLQFPGLWQHGWAARHRTLSPEYQFGECELSPQMKLWVARKDQELFLREHGFAKARAIGLPVVYVPRSSTKRIPNSLLVVPAHSLEYTTHSWKFDEYADQINAVRRDFDSVAAIVHQSCIEKGYWVSQFKRLGVNVFPGALGVDPSSLYRLELLFSSFEHVTSNSTGSHIAYASLWGAKVSVFGTYAEVRKEDYANTPFFQSFPHLLEPALCGTCEQTTRQHFPEFFVDHPHQAEPRIEWAEFQVGADNRLSPHELRKAFGWTLSRRIAVKGYKIAAPIAEEWLPEAVKRPLRKRLYPQLAFQEDLEIEAKRIAQLPADQEASTTLLGPKLLFPNGPSCAYQLTSIFGREVYKFKTLNPQPIIIDGGANIGLASIYLSRLFPDARISAYEPDPEICEILTTNLKNFSVENVVVYQAALWLDDSGIQFKPDGSDGGKIVFDSTTNSMLLPSTRLRDQLAQRVDFLKLDIEGAELQVLLDCNDRLCNVERIFVEYHGSFGSPQRAGELLQLLTDAGFRLHIHSPLPAQQPLVHRPITSGYDMLLEVFAFR